MSYKEGVAGHLYWLQSVFIPFALALPSDPPLKDVIPFDRLVTTLKKALREDGRGECTWIPVQLELEWLRHAAARDLKAWGEAETVLDFIASCHGIIKICDGERSHEEVWQRSEHLADMLALLRFDYTGYTLTGISA